MNATRDHNHSRFDPFVDRRSRDIRNDLSEALVDALAANDRSIYRHCSRKWLSSDLPPSFETYIRDRIDRYDRLLSRVENRVAKGPHAVFIDIWNERLFFEAHEYLETIWQRASGDEHQALKGLIKAAGVYVHLENSHPAAARRLASKALRQMKDFAGCLGFIANLDVLLDCIQNLTEEPPRLAYSEAFDS